MTTNAAFPFKAALFFLVLYLAGPPPAAAQSTRGEATVREVLSVGWQLAPPINRAGLGDSAPSNSKAQKSATSGCSCGCGPVCKCCCRKAPSPQDTRPGDQAPQLCRCPPPSAALVQSTPNPVHDLRLSGWLCASEVPDEPDSVSHSSSLHRRTHDPPGSERSTKHIVLII